MVNIARSPSLPPVIPNEMTGALPGASALPVPLTGRPAPITVAPLPAALQLPDDPKLGPPLPKTDPSPAFSLSMETLPPAMLDDLILATNQLCPMRPPTVAPPLEPFTPDFAPSFGEALLPFSSEEKKEVLAELATSDEQLDTETQEIADTVVRDETHTKQRTGEALEKRAAEHPRGRKAMSDLPEDMPVIMPPLELSKVEDSLTGLLSMDGMSIEQLVQLVMFELQRSAQQDVKDLLDEVQANNDRKEAMRAYDTQLSEMRAELDSELRNEYDRRCSLSPSDPMYIDPSQTSYEAFVSGQEITLMGPLPEPGETIPEDVPGYVLGTPTLYTYASDTVDGTAPPAWDETSDPSTGDVATQDAGAAEAPGSATAPDEPSNPYGVCDSYDDALHDFWDSLTKDEKDARGGSFDAFCSSLGLPSSDSDATVEAFFAGLGEQAAPGAWNDMATSTSSAPDILDELQASGYGNIEQLTQDYIAATLRYEQARNDEENSNQQTALKDAMDDAKANLDAAISGMPNEKDRANACNYVALRSEQVAGELYDAYDDFRDNWQGHGDKLDTDDGFFTGDDDYYAGMDGKSDILGGTWMDTYNADKPQNGHKDRNEVIVHTSYVTGFGGSDMLIDYDACVDARSDLLASADDYRAGESEFAVMDEDTLDVVQAFNKGEYDEPTFAGLGKAGVAVESQLYGSASLSQQLGFDASNLRMTAGVPADDALRDTAAPPAAPTSTTLAQIDANKEAWDGAKDSLDELGDELSLKLQMAMDRLSQVQSTLSNTMKKISETASGIIANMK